MNPLDALTAQVEANTNTEASAVMLLTQLAAQVEATKNDPAKVQALADHLRASADALGAAIVANTPAGPPATARRKP